MQRGVCFQQQLSPFVTFARNLARSTVEVSARHALAEAVNRGFESFSAPADGVDLVSTGFRDSLPSCSAGWVHWALERCSRCRSYRMFAVNIICENLFEGEVYIISYRWNQHHCKAPCFLICFSQMNPSRVCNRYRIITYAQIWAIQCEGANKQVNQKQNCERVRMHKEQATNIAARVVK